MEGALRRRSGEGMRRAAIRLRSHGKIVPQESAKARGGAVLYTAPRRGHDLAQRGEAQGG